MTLLLRAERDLLVPVQRILAGPTAQPGTELPPAAAVEAAATVAVAVVGGLILLTLAEEAEEAAISRLRPISCLTPMRSL